MALRYEIKDAYHPKERGQRFSTVERGMRELAKAFPPGRWELIDRDTKEVIAVSE